MKATCVALIVIASTVCSWAESKAESSILAAPGKNVSNVNSTAAVPSGLGEPSSRAEEVGWPAPPVYELKPEYIEAMRLTKEQEKTLYAYMPGFNLWTMADYPAAIKYYSYTINSLPYIVKGDFDGNGKYDLVLAGHVNDENMLLAIMSDSTGYYVLPILTYTNSPDLDVLYILRKGTIFSLDNDSDDCKEETLSQDAIQLAQISSNAISFNGRSSAQALLRFKEELVSVHPLSNSYTMPSPFKSKYLKNLSLTPIMKKFVHAYDKHFKTWALNDYPAYITEAYHYSAKSLPYAVKGDFNGDGLEDMVIAGHNNDGNRIVTLLSNATGYLVGGGGDNCYLETRKLGKQIPYMPSYVLKLHGIGLKVAYENRSDLPVILNTESYSFQTFAGCSNNVATKNGDSIIAYGDWHKVEETPGFSGFVKNFYRSDGLPLRLIRPPSSQGTGR